MSFDKLASRESSLSGWILAQVEGKAYLGNPPPGWAIELQKAANGGGIALGASAPVRLEPVYEFTFMAVPTPQGMAMQPTLKNPFGCPSIRSITLPYPGIWVALADLAEDERRVFEQLVTMTEEGLRKARAAAAGVMLAPAGTELPPMSHLGGNGGRR